MVTITAASSSCTPRGSPTGLSQRHHRTSRTTDMTSIDAVRHFWVSRASLDPRRRPQNLRVERESVSTQRPPTLAGTNSTKPHRNPISLRTTGGLRGSTRLPSVNQYCLRLPHVTCASICVFHPRSGPVHISYSVHVHWSHRRRCRRIAAVGHNTRSQQS